MSLFTRPRLHAFLRYLRIAVSAIAASLAVAIIATLTIDLGPSVRELAERAGSRQIERPMHIGRLSIHLLSGRVIVEEFSIDGLHPGDRQFFKAGRLTVSLDWWTAIRPRPEITITAVELTDWQMLVEKWEDEHNFPKFKKDDEEEPPGPKRFTTTLRYLRAWRGQFTFEDHEAPWGVVCPNLDITITNLPEYHGQAVFKGGAVMIQDFEPLWTDMKAQFTIDGPMIRLQRIDLDTDGARTVADGVVDMAHWPEQQFHVKSQIRFPRMREIFFKDEPWDVTGDGTFDGIFHLFKGGRDLSGRFASRRLGVKAGAREYPFPALHGSLRWTPRLFEVTDAGAGLFGGTSAFSYSIAPLGHDEKPIARFAASYADADLAAVSDFYELRGQRFGGRVSGENLLEWPLGRFVDNHGAGRVSVVPPPGTPPFAAGVAWADRTLSWGPYLPGPMPRYLPVSGEAHYALSAEEITFDGGRFTTPRTAATFEGSTAWGERSRIAFHVSSADWQESDQVMAGIITDFGDPVGPVAFGGRGEFDGAMTGPFRRPRVEGDFRGEDLRAWDTNWGAATGHVVFEAGLIRISDSLVRRDDAEIRADGLFSTSSPRSDGHDEIDARVRVLRYDIRTLRHAFQIDDYPVLGRLSGEFHVTGEYARPFGFGSMSIDAAVAYGEPLQKATAAVRMDGRGIRLENVLLEKGAGTVTGAAFVGWDGTYSFNADGHQIPIERIAAFDYPRAPLSGSTEFTAAGNGAFENPRYDVRFRVRDLFVADEGVGEVTGVMAVRGKELSGEVDVASPRLAITGTGRISLTPRADAELTFRFHDSSLDPYVRLFVPRLSPFTTAVASGAIRVSGELSDLDHLLVDGTVDNLEMRLFDYALRNAAPIRLSLDRRQVNVQDLQVIGEDTRLRVAGKIDLAQHRIALQASGDANLGILQGFMRNVRGAGRAELAAAVDGPIDQPVFSGRATISKGRIRHFALPAALDAINGTIFFDANGLRFDDVTATMGEGRVQFGGRVGFDGYMPGELNVTARGTDVRLRYPEGVRSVVDADLAVRGNFKAPTLSGTFTVKSALWSRRIDAPGNIFDLAGRRSPSPGSGDAAPADVGAVAPVPLRFDLQILVPSTLRVDTNLVRLVANADLSLKGTYDKPVLLGHADIDRGEVSFEGRRYRLTRGTMDFTNPSRIEPFFDISAETTVRVPGQTYRVTIAMTGTTERMQPAFSSDPPLPSGDVLALLFGGSQRTQNAEIRALQNPNERQADILTTRATQALTGPLSAEVGKVVEQTFGIDTFQLSPSLLDPFAQQAGRVNPSARLTIGKRISERAYLTFSRSLNSTVYDQIILLEYDATDRLSWILSRNEDQTFALEFRVRHAF